MGLGLSSEFPAYPCMASLVYSITIRCPARAEENQPCALGVRPALAASTEASSEVTCVGRVCVYIYICTYVCVYTYIYIYTYYTHMAPPSCFPPSAYLCVIFFFYTMLCFAVLYGNISHLVSMFFISICLYVYVRMYVRRDGWMGGCTHVCIYIYI